MYGPVLCYEDATELQLGAGQLVFVRGLELMFTVVFFLLVAMVPFMECKGVVVLRWDFLFPRATEEVYSVFTI